MENSFSSGAEHDRRRSYPTREQLKAVVPVVSQKQAEVYEKLGELIRNRDLSARYPEGVSGNNIGAVSALLSNDYELAKALVKTFPEHSGPDQKRDTAA